MIKEIRKRRKGRNKEERMAGGGGGREGWTRWEEGVEEGLERKE